MSSPSSILLSLNRSYLFFELIPSICYTHQSWKGGEGERIRVEAQRREETANEDAQLKCVVGNIPAVPQRRVM